jgi:hypothetical protein
MTDETLQVELRDRISVDDPIVARHARWVLEGLGSGDIPRR